MINYFIKFVPKEDLIIINNNIYQKVLILIQELLQQNSQANIEVITNITMKNYFYQSIRTALKNNLASSQALNIDVYNLLVRLLNNFYWICTDEMIIFFNKYRNNNLIKIEYDKGRNNIQISLKEIDSKIINIKNIYILMDYDIFKDGNINFNYIESLIIKNGSDGYYFISESFEDIKSSFLNIGNTKKNTWVLQNFKYYLYLYLKNKFPKITII